jgi:hypothetical protein
VAAGEAVSADRQPLQLEAVLQVRPTEQLADLEALLGSLFWAIVGNFLGRKTSDFEIKYLLRIFFLGGGTKLAISR